MKELTPLENQLLITLSFLEPMSLEYIFIDLDKDFLLNNNELTTKDLELALASLVTAKKLKLLKAGKDKSQKEMWIKLFPKKSIFTRFRRFFKL
jgi:hypothetical protein